MNVTADCTQIAPGRRLSAEAAATVTFRSQQSGTVESRSAMGVSLRRCRPEGGAGFRLDQPDDWLGLVATHCNLLVTGPDAATDAFVLAAMPILRAPLQRISCEEGLTLGAA